MHDSAPYEISHARTQTPLREVEENAERKALLAQVMDKKAIKDC